MTDPEPAESTSNRELAMRIRLIEQENEVPNRAAAYLSSASLPRDLSIRSFKRWTADGIPVPMS